ncbi:MAG TPA: SpoIIE family protein phosphatase, partial [Solirubrobacteraceae bacterium]|nr:SpoIIE family protein phosphatase [Solirubrobacteraceae bacterium]
QMRSALRAILMQADDTGKMADRLNRFTLGLGSDEAIMTTVVLAILEPGTGTLRFTNAGHPPPLLVGAAGSAAYLDEPPSPPMGVLATPRYKEHTRRLEPGATLVLYTDGLVEESTEVLDVGLERLRVAATAMGHDVERSCELLLDSLRDDTARSDDVTLLVVRLQEALGEKVTLEVSNESGGLFTMRQTLRRWLVEQGADADETEDVIMACNEACENSVEHGYDCGDDLFAVEFTHDAGEIAISVRDHGTWRERQENSDRGRGLPLMRKLMDVVEVQPRPGGTTVRMSRRLAVAPAAGQAGASSRSSG